MGYSRCGGWFQIAQLSGGCISLGKLSFLLFVQAVRLTHTNHCAMLVPCTRIFSEKTKVLWCIYLSPSLMFITILLSQELQAVQLLSSFRGDMYDLSCIGNNTFSHQMGKRVGII